MENREKERERDEWTQTKRDRDCGEGENEERDEERVRKSGQIERKRINIKPGSLAKHLKTSVYFILNIEFNPQQSHCAWPIYVIMHMQMRIQT